MTEPGGMPVTRRELRLAQTASATSSDLPAEQTTSEAPHDPPSTVLPALTRRELRAIEREASTVEPPAAPTSSEVTAMAPPSGTVNRSTAWPSSAGRRPLRVSRVTLPRVHGAPMVAGVGLVLAVTLVTGSVSHAHVEAARAAAAQAEVAATAAAARAEQANQVRSHDASEVRLASAAAGYAAGRRSDALVTARAAVQTGDAVLTTATAVVSPEQISPLDQAVAQLNLLIETAAEPQKIVADAAAELRPASLPVGTAAAHDGAPEVSPPVPWVIEPSPTTETAGPATVVPPVDSPVAAPPAVPTSASATLPEALVVTDVLELAMSAQIVAVAEEVAVLSVQVQAVADANIAAAEAAARAAEEAAAAQRWAEAEKARMVEVAADSSNGDIPVDVLCGVSFERDARIRCDAVDSLEDLNTAFRAKFGRSLSIDSSYRDYATQVMTKRLRGNLAAAAGTSNHGRALAIDLGGMGGLGQFDLPTYRWMKAHAHKYGWYHPSYMEPGGAGPQEPWHWEFGKL